MTKSSAALPRDIKSNSKRKCWLVVEPHFDDACFSYAGTMLAQRELFDSLCIMTVFSRSPYTTSDYKLLTNDLSVTETVSAIRKAEGLQFAKAIQAEAEFSDLPEALLRGYTSTFAAPTNADRLKCLSRIRDEVCKVVVQRQIERLSFPLGAASHLDHKLVGDALLDLVVDESSPLRHLEILAYRENPYAFDNPMGVAARVSYIEKLWRVTLSPISQDTTAVMKQKLKLIDFFKSQLSDEISKIEMTDRKEELNNPVGYREIAWSVNVF